MNRKSLIFKKNITLIFFYKFISILFIYLTVPILIAALGIEKYGIWITIYSLFGWIYFLDLGITNGLKNKLTVAFQKNNKDAIEYITTSYISLSAIAFLFFIIGSVLIYFLNLNVLFNLELDEWYVKTLFFITLISFVFIFVLSLYKQLFYARQQSARVELSSMLFNGLVFVILVLFLYNFESSLVSTSVIYGISNIVICLTFTYLFFKAEKQFSFSFRNFKKEKVKNLKNISASFFIIQLCVLIILATDNILVIKLLGPSEVTSYNNVFKLFQLFLIISALIHAPLWPLYTDAYYNKDLNWIKNTIKKLNYLLIILILVVVITIYLGPEILAFWIKEEISYDPNLLLFMGVFVIVRVFGEIYITFLNSIGKIRIQLFISIVAAIINIPLSIFFVRYYNLGNSGVILATIISMSLYAIVMPIQAISIIRGTIKTTEKY